MIINATTGAGFGGALAYIHKKDVELTNDQKPIVLEMNHVYGEPEKQAKLMRDVAKENSRSSRPVLHLSISFSEDEKLSPKKVEEVLHQVIKEYGATAENNQYVIVKHNDASHEHYHILLNKVGFDGKNIDTSYIQNKSHAIADKIEKEQSLVPTQGRTIFYDPSSEKGYRFASKEEKVEIRKSKAIATNKKLPIAKREQEKVLKQEIQNKVIDVLQSAKTPQEFKEKLAFKNVEVNFKENVNGISGVTFTSDKLTVKGSDVRFKWGEIKAILTNNLEKSHAQNIDMPIVQPPVQQSFKAQQKAKETTLNPNTAIAQAQTAREEIAEKLQTNLDQVAPGATPTKTPAVEPTANDFIAKNKWEDKYLYRGKNPDPKGTINSVALQETFKLALEMKASMPKLVNYSDQQIADQAIRLSMGNYKMVTFYKDEYVSLTNPWDKWEQIGGKNHYEQLVKTVEEQKRGEIIILAENTKIESINQKIDIEEEQEQRRKSNRLGM